MYYLIYTSYASNKFTDINLKSLLLQSREKNAIHAITGMLYYYQNAFIQLIEGDEMEVRKLYETIVADPRHKHVITIKEGNQVSRFFPEWSMGYKFLNESDLNGAENLGAIDAF